jgi:hypothetical protein
MNITVSEKLVAYLMSNAGIRGLPGPAKVKRLHGIATADDLVHRKFHRLAPSRSECCDDGWNPSERRKSLLLRAHGHVLPEDRGVVDRQRSRLGPRGQPPVKPISASSCVIA